MITDRQKLILKAIVEEYIDSNEPIGSKVLTEKPYLDFSSATLRYDMQKLEENGFLEKTHTSSGRVPSQKGYKFYVDNMITRDDTISGYYPAIDEIFDNKYLSRDEVIRNAMDFISEKTGYMSLLLGTSSSFATVKKMEIVPLGEKEAVLLIVTSQGMVESQRVIIPEGYKLEDLLRLIDMFDNAMYDHSIFEITQILSKEAMKPRIRKMVDFHDDVLNFMIKGFARFQNQEKYSSGLTKIFNQPEFYNHESMERILEMIDDDTLMNVLKDCGHGLTVKIGNENELNNMKNCSLVSIPYFIGDNAYGVICVIGPIRMQYKQVLPMLEYVANGITKLYKK